MKFLKNFLLNLIFMTVILVLFYILMPDIMRGIYQLYSNILGTGLLILLLIWTALPGGRKRR